MLASITSIPAIFTIPRARLLTVTLAAHSSLVAIGMTSRHGIFPLTGVATNVGRAATVFLNQMPAAGVLAASR
jgi:hypothetical protein